MAKEQETKRYLEDVVTLQYADVAMRMGSDQNLAPFMGGALEKLISDVKTAIGEKGYLVEGLEKGALSNEEGKTIAAAIYSKMQKEAFGKMSFSEFYDLRLKQLTSLLGKEKAEKAKDALAKYEGQTIGSVLQKYSQAGAILEDKTGLYDEKKKKEAEKTKKDLESVYKIVSEVELWNYWELMPGAAKGILKKDISEAIDKLTA